MALGRYIVRSGDTLQKISTKCLGSPSHWNKIAQYNQLTNPNKIFVGQTLEIPETASQFNQTALSTLSKNQHVVAYGDTLWKISARYLGNSERWREIALLNKIQNPDYLFIGQVLELPPGSMVSTTLEQAEIIPNKIASSSLSHRPATLVPVRGFFFVIADEFNPLRKKYVRKIIMPTNLQDNPELLKRIMNPEKYGFFPRDATSKVSVGRHVLGRTDSRFISASELPQGSPRFQGDKYWIDAQKLERSGFKIYDAEDIAKDLDRIAAKTKDKGLLNKIEYIREKSLLVDKEVLLEGEIPAKFIKGRTAMNVTRGLQIVNGVGIVLSVYDMGKAGYESYELGTPKPLVAESVRQGGGWASGVLGFKIGAGVGALCGIETGPGALFFAGVGGLIFGTAGYFGADWVASYIHEPRA